jgi:glycerol-3-phosphate dehydrogenase
MSTPLNTLTPRIEAGLTQIPESVDLVVIGLGITGVGVALDAAARGMSVLAVDAHDLAFGTSRWSSKLVHGGLRYLANGQFGVAHESAVERGILMETTAPHLTKPLGNLVPLTKRAPMIMRAALFAGDMLRRSAGTSSELLPPGHFIPVAEAMALAPGLRREGLRGAMLSWDGQLIDDARLVTAIARTAVQNGAHIRTRSRFLGAESGQVLLRDELTGSTHRISARGVVNAAGVWAGKVAELLPTPTPPIKLKPSRGTHLVLKPDPNDPMSRLRTAVMVPFPGSNSRFAFVLPQADGTAYVGLTDEPAGSEIPDVPQATEVEIGFLLDVVSSVFAKPLRKEDLAGTFAGLRPLLEASGETADLSRKHAVIEGRAQGLECVTVVGGKLTTYRRMAQDTVDSLPFAKDFNSCSTTALPLAGAAPRDVLANLREPERLVARYGTDAGLVMDNARKASGLGDEELLAPIAPGVPTTLAELIFGVTHEGAHDVADLLERRTRVSLVPADLQPATGAAERALKFGTSAG